VIDRAEVRAQLGRAQRRAARFTGWSFDDLKKRFPDGREPWDYVTKAADALPQARSAVDLDTGGGERFEEIVRRAGSGARLYATEEWHVNAPVAARRLTPLGVHVVRACGERLPFEAGAFDLLLNRHGTLAPAEVNRVLAPGGLLLTQQVIPDQWPELRAYFPRKAVFPPHDVGYAAEFRALGYAVSFQERRYPVTFASLEDVAFMLFVVPWAVPDIDPDLDLEAFMALAEQRADAGGSVTLTEGLYLIEALKPG
jgi:SAM-dependent methyltransferase